MGSWLKPFSKLSSTHCTPSVEDGINKMILILGVRTPSIFPLWAKGLPLQHPIVSAENALLGILKGVEIQGSA